MELLNIERTLSVMLTYRCNAECADCGTLSNPRIQEKLSKIEVVAAIKQAKKLGFRNVVFTGGEATIYGDLLKTGIKTATQKGLMTRLVTNGVWAKNIDRAKEKISEWISLGLDEINLSTGDEHQRFVPQEFIINAIEASIELNARCLLMIEKFRGSKVNKENFLNDSSINEAYKKGQFSIIESPWMPLDPGLERDYESGETAHSKNLASFGGCDSVLQTYVLGPDPGVYSCCGIGARNIPELCSQNKFDLHNQNSLEDIIFNAEQDFLKLWIRAEGTEKILSWCSEKDNSVKWENMYAHKCQACLRVYSDEKIASIIRNNFSEKIPDIVIREYVSENIGTLVNT